MIAPESIHPFKEVLFDDEEEGAQNTEMQFRLTYEGRIQSAQRANSKQKHEIRKIFHRQLKRLWEFNPFLKSVVSTQYGFESRKELLGVSFSRCGYKFVPIAYRTLHVDCGLDILFLRPEPPGSIVHSGDIDNRIKTVIDALKMPANSEDLGGYNVPEKDEDPFFVLVEDDRQITRLSVETDMLLQPINSTQPSKLDSRLIITVRVTPYELTSENKGL